MVAFDPTAVDPSGKIDFQLSDHFSFFEMTQTSNSDLQGLNRQRALEVLPSLKTVAALMEGIRVAIGEPLLIHSGFRCPELNGQTKGSASHSQHLLGEACDFTRLYDDGDEHKIEYLFNNVVRYLTSANIPFGQVIREYADRGYGKSCWVHFSLGKPYRDPEKCGEIMTMMAGPDGIPHYTLLQKVGV